MYFQIGGGHIGLAFFQSLLRQAILNEKTKTMSFLEMALVGLTYLPFT